MAEFVKQKDSGRHIITIGFSGLDLIISKEIDIGNLDILTFHLGGKVSPYLLKSKVIKLRKFLQEQKGDKAISIEEIGLSSKDFEEVVRAEVFQKWFELAKGLDVSIFLWWVLKDIPKDPTAVDGDRIQIEPHQWGIFNADGSSKGESTQEAIEIGKEATRLIFK